MVTRTEAAAAARHDASRRTRPRVRLAQGSNVVLVLVCLAQFMVILDVSIVNVALPSIRSGLHFSTTGLQ